MSSEKEIVKFNIKLPKEINEWFKEEGNEKYVSKRGKQTYIQDILIAHYKRRKKNV